MEQSKGVALACMAPNRHRDQRHQSDLALAELVQAHGTAIDLTGPAPQRLARIVPPGLQGQQPPPNVLLQVQLETQSGR